jgi:hypothetical protein
VKGSSLLEDILGWKILDEMMEKSKNCSGERLLQFHHFYLPHLWNYLE